MMKNEVITSGSASVSTARERRPRPLFSTSGSSLPGFAPSPQAGRREGTNNEEGSMDKHEIERALRIIYDQRMNVKEGTPEWKNLDKAALYLEKLIGR